MMKHMKVLVRDRLPKRYQVPAKYWYGVARGTAEAELGLLGKLIGPGSHAIDIGGNRGLYTYGLWRLGAKVDVFEPNPACLRVLSPWAAGKPGIRVHSVALSSHSGSASLHVPVDEAGIAHDASGSIEHGGFDRAHDQTVTMRTLDSYGFTGIDFIKIDVEGHEYSVIEGAAETCASSQPAMLVEIEQRHNARGIDDVFKKIASLGYDGFFLSSGRLNRLKQFDAAHDQAPDVFGVPNRTYVNNFLFLHGDRIAARDYGDLLNGAEAA